MFGMADARERPCLPGTGRDIFHLDVRSRTVQTQPKHKIVISGIAESLTSKQAPANRLATAIDLRKARRLAAKLGSSSEDSECKRAKRKLCIV